MLRLVPLLPGKIRCDSYLWPGNFLIAGMNAPDQSGRVLLGQARPLSYRPRGRGGAGLVLNERTRGPL